MKSAECINKIIEASVLGGLEQLRDDVACRTFGIGKDGFSFHGPNIHVLHENLVCLHSQSEALLNSYTFKKCESNFVEFFGNNIRNKLLVNNSDVNSFFQKLEAVELQHFYVLRDVYGLKLKDSSDPFKLGPYTIYHFPTHRLLIESRTTIASEWIWSGENPTYLIETIASARHSEKAVEKADILFEKFEYALRFAIGFDRECYEVGVINYLGWRRRRAYSFSVNGSVSLEHKNLGISELIPIDSPYFSSADHGVGALWNSLAATNTSELKKKVLLAVDWIGQSYSETSPSSAFLKSAIALEILFTYNEKNIINASILNQIAESTALLLGKNVEERLTIESRMKQLYGMRSSIAHAGKSNVNRKDLIAIFSYSRSVVMKFLVNDSLAECRSSQDLYLYLKKCKYSCTEI